MVLYFKSGDDVFLLLADHRKSTRGWGAFGGGPHEGESAAQTAARETEEETRGYFPRHGLLKMIQGQEPAIDHNGFAMYFAEIPFVPAQRVTNNPIPSGDNSYRERGPYAWIPYSEISRHLKGPVSDGKHPLEVTFLPGKRSTSWLWPIWLGSFSRAIETDSVPWTKVSAESDAGA